MGLVLISHSGTLVDGLRDMVAQVAGDEVAVGDRRWDRGRSTGDQRAADRGGAPVDAGRRRRTGSLVLLDLGSAALSLELALEDLEPADRERVRVSEAPLVEGAILAAVQASIGASLDEVAAAAAGAATMPKLPRA